MVQQITITPNLPTLPPRRQIAPSGPVSYIDISTGMPKKDPRIDLITGRDLLESIRKRRPVSQPSLPPPMFGLGGRRPGPYQVDSRMKTTVSFPKPQKTQILQTLPVSQLKSIQQRDVDYLTPRKLTEIKERQSIDWSLREKKFKPKPFSQVITSPTKFIAAGFSKHDFAGIKIGYAEKPIQYGPPTLTMKEYREKLRIETVKPSEPQKTPFDLKIENVQAKYAGPIEVGKKGGAVYEEVRKEIDQVARDRYAYYYLTEQEIPQRVKDEITSEFTRRMEARYEKEPTIIKANTVQELAIDIQEQQDWLNEYSVVKKGLFGKALEKTASLIPLKRIKTDGPLFTYEAPYKPASNKIIEQKEKDLMKDITLFKELTGYKEPKPYYIKKYSKKELAGISEAEAQGRPIIYGEKPEDRAKREKKAKGGIFPSYEEIGTISPQAGLTISEYKPIKRTAKEKLKLSIEKGTTGILSYIKTKGKPGTIYDPMRYEEIPEAFPVGTEVAKGTKDVFYGSYVLATKTRIPKDYADSWFKEGTTEEQKRAAKEGGLVIPAIAAAYTGHPFVAGWLAGQTKVGKEGLKGLEFASEKSAYYGLKAATKIGVGIGKTAYKPVETLAYIKAKVTPTTADDLALQTQKLKREDFFTKVEIGSEKFGKKYAPLTGVFIQARAAPWSMVAYATPKAIKEKPLETAGKVAMGFGFKAFESGGRWAGVGLLGKIDKSLFLKGRPIAGAIGRGGIKVAGAAYSYGLPVVYGATIVKEYKSVAPEFREEKLGEIRESFGAIFIGGALAGKTLQKFDVRTSQIKSQQDALWSLGISPKPTKGVDFRYRFTEKKLTRSFREGGAGITGRAKGFLSTWLKAGKEVALQPPKGKEPLTFVGETVKGFKEQKTMFKKLRSQDIKQAKAASEFIIKIGTQEGLLYGKKPLFNGKPSVKKIIVRKEAEIYVQPKIKDYVTISQKQLYKKVKTTKIKSEVEGWELFLKPRDTRYGYSPKGLHQVKSLGESFQFYQKSLYKKAPAGKLKQEREVKDVFLEKAKDTIESSYPKLSAKDKIAAAKEIAKIAKTYMLRTGDTLGGSTVQQLYQGKAASKEVGFKTGDYDLGSKSVPKAKKIITKLYDRSKILQKLGIKMHTKLDADGTLNTQIGGKKMGEGANYLSVHPKREMDSLIDASQWSVLKQLTPYKRYTFTKDGIRIYKPELVMATKEQGLYKGTARLKDLVRVEQWYETGFKTKIGRTKLTRSTKDIMDFYKANPKQAGTGKKGLRKGNCDAAICDIARNKVSKGVDKAKLEVVEIKVRIAGEKDLNHMVLRENVGKGKYKYYDPTGTQYTKKLGFTPKQTTSKLNKHYDITSVKPVDPYLSKSLLYKMDTLGGKRVGISKKGKAVDSYETFLLKREQPTEFLRKYYSRYKPLVEKGEYGTLMQAIRPIKIKGELAKETKLFEAVSGTTPLKPPRLLAASAFIERTKAKAKGITEGVDYGIDIVKIKITPGVKKADIRLTNLGIKVFDGAKLGKATRIRKAYPKQEYQKIKAIKQRGPSYLTKKHLITYPLPSFVERLYIGPEKKYQKKYQAKYTKPYDIGYIGSYTPKYDESYYPERYAQKYVYGGGGYDGYGAEYTAPYTQYEAPYTQYEQPYKPPYTPPYQAPYQKYTKPVTAGRPFWWGGDMPRGRRKKLGYGIKTFKILELQKEFQKKKPSKKRKNDVLGSEIALPKLNMPKINFL